MATQPQFEDAEPLPDNSRKQPSDRPLSEDEMAALRSFLLLLDEWDRRGGQQ